MTKNYYLAINLANNFQSRYPGIGTTTIPGFGIEKSGRDPGIRDPGIAIPICSVPIVKRFRAKNERCACAVSRDL